MPRRLPFQLASLLIACGAAACAQAAELGDIRVNSYLGQHLSADIELTSLDDPATPVKVRLASIDVYRGANLDMPAVLSSVYMNVVRRDGKQFLHVTSTRPVDADHLHLYLDLTDGSHTEVRLATLWFAPDPNPPAYVPLPPAAAPALPSAAPRRKPAPIRPLPEAPVPKAKVGTTAAVAPVGTSDQSPHAQSELKLNPAEAKTGAPANTSHKTPVLAIATMPAASASTSTTSAATTPAATTSAATTSASTPATSAAKPLAASAQERPTSVLARQPARPAPLKLATPSSTLACRKQALHAESTCSALDNKNAELRAEIGKLEARVNTLLAQQNHRQPEVSKPAAKQVSSPPAPHPAQPDRPTVNPGVPKPAESAPATERPGQSASGKVTSARPLPEHAGMPASVLNKPVAAHAQPAPSGMPWGGIAASGAAVFAVIGALRFWRHRRKQPKPATVHAPLPDDEAEVQVEPTLG